MSIFFYLKLKLPSVIPQHTNHMNNSLLSLYRKGNPDENGTPTKSQSHSPAPTSGIDQPTGGASGTSAPPSSGTLVSGGGWFIDKRQRVEPNILIDLCDDEPRSPSVNVCIFIIVHSKITLRILQ